MSTPPYASAHHPARRWRPGPLLWLTFGLHLGTLPFIAWRPDLWPWPLAALVINHIALTAAGLWPRSQLLGPNWTRLPMAAAQSGAVAITIDDGPDPEVTPQVLDLLDRHQARATFFCIGARAAAQPELCREIIRRGHAIGNHSQNHRHHFSTFGPRRMSREITMAQDTLTSITGQRPRFFRPTAGLRNPFLEPILARHGLTLASWTRRGFDSRETDAGTVAARLLDGLRAGDILLLHDGHAARSRDGEAIILAVLPGLLEAIARAGLRTVTLHDALDRPGARGATGRLAGDVC